MLVPKLRFKEFNDEWNCKLFSEIFEFIQNNSFSRDMLNYSENSKIYNIHYGDILTKYGEIIDFNMISNIVPKINNDISLLKFEDKSYLKDGDIIISDTAEDLTVGKACEITNLYYKALAGLHTIPCRPKFKFASQYLGVYINSPSYHSQLIPFVTGIKVSSISKNNIIKTIMYFPSIKEQEKISKLFSLLNKKIELQQRKIEVLKMYKTGLINKIYNIQYNNTLRLKDLIKEKSIRNKQNTVKEVYSVNNKYGFILQTEQFKDREVASEDTSNYKIVQYNDFAYNPARINVGSIARMKKYNKGIISPMYICFSCKEKLSPEYLEYYYDSEVFRHEMTKRLEGSVRMCLSYESMTNIPVDLPKVEEQKRMTKVLAEIDNKIEKEEKIFSAIKRLKKGLLQRMFI